jgi:putative sulfotransferase
MRLTFIVGSGRCGSTMLSDALRDHPHVLSLSEFFACLSPSAFPSAPVDGTGFWEILSTPRLKPNTLIRHGIAASEFLYPGHGRFQPGAIPAISLVTLPHLRGPEPDLLFDELAEAVARWPVAELAEHYRRLFRWLLRRLDRQIVVERSGGSLRFVRRLTALFPEARFVHLHRTGPDAAVSMSRHPSFRLAVVLSEIIQRIGVDPYHVPSDDHAALLPPDLRQFLPEHFHAEALRGRDIPLVQFGHLWSHQIMEGLVALARVPSSQRISMSYESILAAPARQLATLTRFVGADADADWLRKATTTIDSSRPAGSRAVAATDMTELAAACAVGTRLLRGE